MSSKRRHRLFRGDTGEPAAYYTCELNDENPTVPSDVLSGVQDAQRVSCTESLKKIVYSDRSIQTKESQIITIIRHLFEKNLSAIFLRLTDN